MIDGINNWVLLLWIIVFIVSLTTCHYIIETVDMMKKKDEELKNIEREYMSRD
jgi:beta-lactamase regulating signal transducer with metallopeptidase domain